MPVRHTPLVENYYYHIFNRGVNKRYIFKSKHEYNRFILLLKFYNSTEYPVKFSRFTQLSLDQRSEIWGRLEKDKKHTDIISYCLMPNHFHLLLKQNSENGISKLLANLQNSYAKYFNIKNERVGPLFQGQFKAVKIDSEEQLLHLSRYIHLNPFSTGVVKSLSDTVAYPWSSMPEYLSAIRFPICNKTDILSNFESLKNYKDFVLDNADYQKSLEDLKHLNFD